MLAIAIEIKAGVLHPKEGLAPDRIWSCPSLADHVYFDEVFKSKRGSQMFTADMREMSEKKTRFYKEAFQTSADVSKFKILLFHV
jgi:hypothetical protein